MVRFILPLLCIGGLVTSKNDYAAGFVPASTRQSLRKTDGSQWRLDYRDDGAMIGFNGTVGTMSRYHTPPAVPMKQAIVQPEKKNKDTVDMSHFESSFQGLTEPSKAGLVLSVIISAAVMAASPAVDTSFLTSEIQAMLQHYPSMDLSSMQQLNAVLPAAWLATVQRDISELSTASGDSLEHTLKGAHTLAFNLESSGTVAAQQFQNVMTEQSFHFQKYFQDILEMDFSNSLEWKSIVDTKTSLLQSQASTALHALDATITPKVTAAQNALDQLSDELSTTTTSVGEAFTMKFSEIQESTSTLMSEWRRSADLLCKEMQEAIVAPVEQSAMQMKQNLEVFQQTVDKAMLREGPIIGEKVTATTAEARAIYDWCIGEAKRTIVIPLVDGSTILEKLAEIKTAHEISEAQKAAIAMHTEIQDFCDAQVAEIRNVIVPELSEELGAWYSTTRETFEEWVGIAAVKIPQWRDATVLRCNDIYADVSGRMEQLESTARAQLIENNRAFHGFCDETTTKGSTTLHHATVQASNLLDDARNTLQHFEKDIRSEASTAQTLAKDYLAQAKGWMDAFQESVDRIRLREGPTIGQKISMATTQGQELFKRSITVFDRAVELEKAAELETARIITEAHKTAWQMNADIQSGCEEHMAEFQNVIVPVVSRKLADLSTEAKTILNDGATMLQLCFATTATEVRDVAIPNIMAAIRSFLASSNANSVAEKALIQESVTSFVHGTQDIAAIHYANIQNDYMPNAGKAITSLNTGGQQEIAEIQRAASTVFGSVKGTTQSVISQLQASAKSLAGQGNAAASRVTAGMEAPIFSQVKSSITLIASNVQDSMSSVSTTVAEMADKSGSVLGDGSPSSQELAVGEMKMMSEANAVDIPSQESALAVGNAKSSATESLSSQYDRLLEKLFSL